MKTIVYVAFSAMLFGGNTWAEDASPAANAPEPKLKAALESPDKQAESIYVCPMHPQIRRHEPGNARSAAWSWCFRKTTAMPGRTPPPAPTVQVSPTTAQSMGVRTAKAGERNMARITNTVGYVNYNEDALEHVHTRAKGWVETLNARAAGEKVKKARYCWNITPRNPRRRKRIAGRQTHRPPDVGKRAKIAAGFRRKQAAPAGCAGRHHQQAARWRRNHPPHSGAGTAGWRHHRHRRARRHVHFPESTLYTITNLSSVWVLVDVFDQQMDAVKVGNTAEIRTDALPGHTWEGKVDYIYPDLVGQTRTLKARIKFDMQDAKLKPNMFVDVRIYDATRKALAIPKEAVIPTEDGARVVKVSGKGEYTPADIKTGLSSGDYVEVLDGLKAGDDIVVSGQFLLDSESNLQAGFRRMGAE
ncbi:MAG: efflux RND transporter periplasmic adaptor subunit [Candidatus Thiothrix singaporensis]|uniref:Efflux RND transporter periplasmic adaptor subunit n=1 Tax=Candidatus Thiothrix singaporensis TaxID=2799669 RepID=A0A7L6AMN4_9GAMM|nr:MAG: efflux RND transporter periplasmic adaptor subunit [Candidatus Thiothrix singaporensis]